MPSIAIAAPLSPYGTFSGSLFQYFQSLVAFESIGPSEKNLPPKKCILLGGLSDGLIPTPYTKDLESACHNLGWSLVQPILSSSYLGFGNGSLERDTQEIGQLLSYLHTHRNGEIFALVGHSTGCQDSVDFLKHGDPAMVAKTKVVVLQAPVSDREQPMDDHPNEYQTNLEIATTMVADGKAQEMMPRSAFWAPITAQRFLDLHQRQGRDDYFSSDYTDEELQSRLGHVGRLKHHGLRVLVAYSGADEYVAKHIECQHLCERLVNAMNVDCSSPESRVAEGLYLPTGNHNLSQRPGDAGLFVAKVASLLQSV